MAKAVRVTGLIAPVQKLAESQKDTAFSQLLSVWKTNLGTLPEILSTVDGLRKQKTRLAAGWLAVPKAFSNGLKTLTEIVEAQPDQTATLDAQTFLSTAQARLGDYREAMRKKKAAEISVNAAKEAHKIYCDVMDEELNALYDEVQKDFSTFYRAINGEDEATFTAKLTPTKGRLGLDVNFYERGLYPPGAYHSEGHQDGMGVCLYLALMKRLFGTQFTFALLDDVVMSVDADHRYEFCKLLKTYFPDTQFVITTHDRLWAEQMRSAGLVSAKTSIAFHSWTIDSGPLVESNLAIWDEIDADLDKGKVEAAAAALRHHLEYVCRHIADQIAATPPFRADGNYELGDLMPAVLGSDEGPLWESVGRGAILGKRHGQGRRRKAKGSLVNVERRDQRRAVGHEQGGSLQCLGQFREEGLRARCGSVQGTAQLLLLRGMRRLALCHAAGQTRVAALRLQYGKSQFEAKAKADLGISPWHKAPLHSSDDASRPVPARWATSSDSMPRPRRRGRWHVASTRRQVRDPERPRSGPGRDRRAVTRLAPAAIAGARLHALPLPAGRRRAVNRKTSRAWPTSSGTCGWITSPTRCRSVTPTGRCG